MGNIVLLDDLTINKIAAGEVIERPSSVIKEMVENSIDAGANNITIEIQNGGITYIRITDNGKGILPDDMEFAFERHATSKIRVADDLETVKSMGFRGEALASIAAIANVEMVSRTRDSENGYRVVVEAGKLLEKEETGCPIGTTITVRNLFFNTPVRYKFLKKDYTEAGYIEDVVTRLALANPNIAIKLVVGGKVIIQTSGNGELDGVVYNIFGRDIAKGLIDVKYELEDIKINGVIGKPEIARSNRTNQIFFVNKRYIKDRTLSSAVEQAYKGLIPIGKFGFTVLNIEVDASKVDVNVHPAKLEVRFAEEQKVFKAVYHAIKEGLLGEDLVKNTEKNNIEEPVQVELKEMPKAPSFLDLLKKKTHNKDYKTEKEENIIEEIYTKKEETATIKTPTEEQVSNITNMINPIKEEIEPVIEQKTKENVQEQAEDKAEIKTEENLNMENTQVFNVITEENEKIIEEPKEENFDQMYEKLFGKAPQSNTEEEKVEKIEIKTDNLVTGENISVFEESEEYTTLPNYKFIGIAFSTYIIVEMDKEIYIIDQHAAHERINYEKIKENFYSNQEKDSQLMLLPDIITLSHKEMDIVKENTKMFESAGFIFEEFGDNTIKLTGVPNVCIDLETKELFLEILDQIDTVAITAKQEKEEKFIATIACKASVKANMALTKEEVDELMKKLLVLPNPFTCPHGRPTAIKMTKYDIERKFNRK